MTRVLSIVAACLLLTLHVTAQSARPRPRIGEEVAITRHLQSDEEFALPLAELLDVGRRLFEANWTEEDGGGRPRSKGTGAALSARSEPLTGERNFNRISGPDANSCQGCHNAPHGIAGGGGDFVTNGFESAQRFDFVTFKPADLRATTGTVDEQKRATSLQTIGNLRATPGLFGAGYLEMVARQITMDLQAVRDGLQPGQSKALKSKGISFGVLARHADGTWDVTRVEGLPRQSLLTPTKDSKPSLVLRPWHQAGNVVSLREFTNSAYNRHHGIQTAERFGADTDPDGDGVLNEMTRGDVTAVVMYQATLAVPGRVIPNNPEVERAVLNGENVFRQIQCTTCHVESLPLDRPGWIYSEPSPFNPPANARRRDTRTLSVNLNDASLPLPRLQPSSSRPDVIDVPAYTDFKLHDLGEADPLAMDAIDMNEPTWSPRFAAGNRKFITRRLWGAANEPPYFHHGLFTTMRQAILAHGGEALEQRRAFQQLSKYDQDSVIEFLKTLQVLPRGTTDLIVDEQYRKKEWPPR